MAKILKNIFNIGTDEVKQNFTIESWHVSQSVDALTGTQDYDITISGSLTITGSTNINGVLTVTQGITGSLFGTASWALNAINASSSLNATSASYALSSTSASYSLNSTSASYSLSSSRAISSSYALTSSYALSASYALSSSYSLNSTSASYALSSSRAVSSSYALSASYSPPTTPLPAGSDHEIQFNDNGSLGADPNFTFNNTAAAKNITLKSGTATNANIIFDTTISAVLKGNNIGRLVFISSNDGGSTLSTTHAELVVVADNNISSGSIYDSNIEFKTRTGTTLNTNLLISHSGQISLEQYGGGTFDTSEDSGVAGFLTIDSNGNVLENPSGKMGFKTSINDQTITVDNINMNVTCSIGYNKININNTFDDANLIIRPPVNTNTWNSGDIIVVEFILNTASTGSAGDIHFSTIRYRPKAGSGTTLDTDYFTLFQITGTDSTDAVYLRNSTSDHVLRVVAKFMAWKSAANTYGLISLGGHKVSFT
jgi:hypothetical protein